MAKKQKIIWITGASSGIGKGLVLELNTQENLLLISSRNEKKLQEIKKLSRNPSLIKIFAFDLSNEEELITTSKNIITSYGYISQIYHCGGISQRSLAKETKMSVSRKLMEVNFFSAISLTKQILPTMIQQKSGDIIVISSLAGKFGTPLRSSYSASKHALEGYFESLRYEVSKQGINILIVNPGFIDTDISKNALLGDGSKYLIQDQQQSSGLSIMQCAKKIINAVSLKKNEVRVGGFETLSILIKRFIPNLLPMLVSRNQH